MPVLDAIEAILASDCPDGVAEDFMSERIEGLIAVVGWDAVRESLLSVLAAERRAADYRIVATVFWGAVLDRREMPADRVIALLYHRFDPRGDNEDNLVWSIASKLKGVGYLSDYRPLDDPAVQRELAAIRAG
jgi:hypothetical protein